MKSGLRITLSAAASIVIAVVFSSQALCIEKKKGIWTEGKHCYSVRVVGQERARNLAVEKIKQEAIENLCGLDIISEWVTDMGELVTDVCRALTRANIRSCEIIEEQESKTVDANGRPELFWCVKARVEVVCDEGKRDPSFHLRTTLNRHNFEEGDRLEIEISSTLDCFVHVISIYENGDMYLIFPNFIDQDNHMRPGTMTFPGEGYSIPVEPMTDMEESRETLLTIATKENLPIFGERDFPFEGMRSYGVEVSQDILLDWLTNIERDRRAEDIETYVVHAKEKK